MAQPKRLLGSLLLTTELCFILNQIQKPFVPFNSFMMGTRLSIHVHLHQNVVTTILYFFTCSFDTMYLRVFQARIDFHGISFLICT